MSSLPTNMSSLSDFRIDLNWFAPLDSYLNNNPLMCCPTDLVTRISKCSTLPLCQVTASSVDVWCHQALPSRKMHVMVQMLPSSCTCTETFRLMFAYHTYQEPPFHYTKLPYTAVFHTLCISHILVCCQNSDGMQFECLTLLHVSWMADWAGNNYYSCSSSMGGKNRCHHAYIRVSFHSQL